MCTILSLFHFLSCGTLSLMLLILTSHYSELCLGSLSPSASEGELDMPTSSLVGSHTGRSTSTCSSPLRPVSTNHSPGPSSHFPLSPRHLRYYTDIDSDIFPGMVEITLHSLFAVSLTILQLVHIISKVMYTHVSYTEP